MAKDDLATVEGQISGIRGGGRYSVLLDNGAAITAKLCGKMSKFRIKVVIGDRVIVGLSPYDLAHGLILYRQKV